MSEVTAEMLVALYTGLDRLGPGDDAFAAEVLDALPPGPEHPRIADLGCGTGAGALLLAGRFGSRVIAVDDQQAFLDELSRRAGDAGLQAWIEPRRADMAAPGITPGSLDLIWSEGAAYAMGFATALGAWRPLLRPGGLAAVSELSWWGADIPAEAQSYWAAAYPDMMDEEANAARARDAGFEVLGVRRLPPEAWRRSYSAPLAARLDAYSADTALAPVIAESREEIDMQARHGDAFGYSFYLLRTS